MRLIVARREVTYTGRLNAYLPESTRLLMLKEDGSVLVHADAGGYKPLNSTLCPSHANLGGFLDSATLGVRCADPRRPPQSSGSRFRRLGKLSLMTSSASVAPMQERPPRGAYRTGETGVAVGAGQDLRC